MGWSGPAIGGGSGLKLYPKVVLGRQAVKRISNGWPMTSLFLRQIDAYST